MKDKFSFLYADICFDLTKCRFIFETQQLNKFFVFFDYFCGGDKNN